MEVRGALLLTLLLLAGLVLGHLEEHDEHGKGFTEINTNFELD